MIEGEIGLDGRAVGMRGRAAGVAPEIRDQATFPSCARAW